MKKIVLDDIDYEIVEDKDNCFDLELVKSKFTDYFYPYDYVLGDFAYNKLRLKGFYEDNNKSATKINSISSMDSYLANYCALGCKYFLLKKE